MNPLVSLERQRVMTPDRRGGGLRGAGTRFRSFPGSSPLVLVVEAVGEVGGTRPVFAVIVAQVLASVRPVARSEATLAVPAGPVILRCPRVVSATDPPAAVIAAASSRASLDLNRFGVGGFFFATYSLLDPCCRVTVW
jgi:hypothetical protein